jgi:hypothetical protein
LFYQLLPFLGEATMLLSDLFMGYLIQRYFTARVLEEGCVFQAMSDLFECLGQGRVGGSEFINGSTELE